MSKLTSSANVKKPLWKKWWVWVIAALFVFGVSSLGTSDDVKVTKESKSDSKSSESKESKSKNQTVNVGDIFEFGNFEFTTSNQRILKEDYGDTEYVVVDFKITALKDGLFSGMIQGVTADNVVVNEELVLINSSITQDPISIAFTKDLSKGQAATGYAAFKKEDNVKNIEITSSAFSDKKVTLTLNSY